MKSNIKILTLSLALMLSSVLFSKQAAAQQSNVSFQVFYDQLSPYGQWVNYSNYGYAWVPDMGPDFVPYSTGGHWIMTNYGWTWVSDYDWGWAPFHYGRWDYDNYYGWLWIPDNEWGPSWVTWRRADGYYGWEPMGPGISISLSFGRGYDNRHDHWIFVRDRDIERSDIHRYYVNRTEHERIVRNSTVINKTYYDNSRRKVYVSGPAREDVQRITGRKVNPVTIQESNKPGQNLSNGRLNIYRPQVVKNSDKGQRPAPARITNLKEVKRPSERNATNQPRNVNPQDNNKKEQPRVTKPANTNNRAQPAQPQKANSVNNKGPERQTNPAIPKDNKTQPQNIKPANNRAQQPGNVRPQNNNNNNPPSTQPQNRKPTDNNNREQRPGTLKPQENKVQPAHPQQANPSGNDNNRKAQPMQQPQNAKPADNSRREQQPVNVKPQENRAQPAQPQKVNPPDNNARERQQNNAKPANSNRNEQPKESRPEQERKRE